MRPEELAALRLYRLLQDPLLQAVPGLAAALLNGDEAAIERIERLAVIHEVALAAPPSERDRNRRAEALARKFWPEWFRD